MPRFQSSAFRSGRMNLLLCPVLCCLLSKSTFCTLNPLCVTERYYATISLIYVNVCLKTFKFLEKPGWKSNKIVITNIYLMTPCAATPRLLGATSPLWMISTLHWTVIFTFFFFLQNKQNKFCYALTGQWFCLNIWKHVADSLPKDLSTAKQIDTKYFWDIVSQPSNTANLL